MTLTKHSSQQLTQYSNQVNSDQYWKGYRLIDPFFKHSHPNFSSIAVDQVVKNARAMLIAGAIAITSLIAKVNLNFSLIASAYAIAMLIDIYSIARDPIFAFALASCLAFNI